MELGISRQEVARLREEPAGARRVVQAIVGAAPVFAEPERAYLAVQAHSGSTIPPASGARTWFGPPWLPIFTLSEYRYFSAPILGPEVPAETQPGIGLGWKWGSLTATWDRGALPTRRAAIGVEPFALHVLAVLGMTALYAGALRMRRAMRRRRKLCPQCAYPLQEERVPDATGTAS